MELFPYVLVRLGGQSFDFFEGTNSGDELIKATDHILSQEDEFDRKNLTLNDELFILNQNLSDKKSQNLVQNFRRDLHNKRQPKNNILNDIDRGCIDPKFITGLEEYFINVGILLTLRQNFNAEFDKYVIDQRKQFQRIANDDNLQKGLIISSQSFLSSLKEYITADARHLKKKQLKSEFTLVKYLTRMCTKTSPFSTFNNLVFAKISDLKSDIFQQAYLKRGEPNIQSHIRLNNNILRYLIALLINIEDIVLPLRLRVNPTISFNESNFEFLTNHNNVEAFQKLPNREILMLIFNLVASRKTGISCHMLIKRINDYIEEPESKIYNYIKQLINWGFLEINWTVSGTDPNWDQQFIRSFTKIFKNENEVVNLLVSCLTELRKATQEYGHSALAERAIILENAYSHLKNTCLEIHRIAGLPEIERLPREEMVASLKLQKTNEQNETGDLQENNGDDAQSFEHKYSTFFMFRPEQIIYEDATRNISLQLNKNRVTKLINTLDQLVDYLYLFDVHRDEKGRAANYFHNKYSKSGRVGVLTFYRDYYKDVKLSRNDENDQSQQEKNDSNLNENKDAYINYKSEEHKRNWIEVASKILASKVGLSSDTFNLAFSDLEEIHEKTKIASSLNIKPSGSRGAFLQLFNHLSDNGENKDFAVINHIVHGYGKMTSRFLHIFPHEITKKIRESNENMMSQNNLFLENTDASYFNANLHPALMPYEIRIPGGHNNLNIKKQMAVNDFEVVYDDESEELVLQHISSGKRAFIFDLGFQGKGRSKLFQLLKIFSFGDNVTISGLNSIINSLQKSVSNVSEVKNSVVVFPRIVFADMLFLQRKTWIVKKAILPMRTDSQNDADYFLSVHRWLKKLNMPKKLFMTLNLNRFDNKKDQEETENKFSRDDYKPQFLDLDNPIFISVFERLIAKTSSSVKFEEMVPNADDLIKIGNQRYVSEYLFQWNRGTMSANQSD